MTRVHDNLEKRWAEFATKRDLRSWEDMRPCLREILANPQRIAGQRDRIPLREVPELGLVRTYALVPKTDSGPMGYLRVDSSMMRMWNVGEEELRAAAEDNRRRDCPPCCMAMASMMDQIREAFPETEEGADEFSEVIYVLTNREQFLGAFSMLVPGTLYKVARELNSPLMYIIPSSIHEVLLIPGSAWIDPDDLRQLLRHVNRTEVREEDRLSDDVFCYLGPEDRLFVAEEKRKEHPVEESR